MQTLGSITGLYSYGVPPDAFKSVPDILKQDTPSFNGMTLHYSIIAFLLSLQIQKSWEGQCIESLSIGRSYPSFDRDKVLLIYAPDFEQFEMTYCS